MNTPIEKQTQQLVADNKRLKQQVDRLTRAVSQLERQIRTIKAKQVTTDNAVSVISRIISKFRD